MKKPLIALTAAALLLAATGCAADNEAGDSGSASSTSAAASPSASASATPSASGTPSGTPSPSASSSAEPIAPGFPTDVLPIMPDSTPLATSFETAEEVFTASLTATTSAGTEAVLAYYAAEFTAQGFTPTEAENQGTATLRQFVRSGGEEVANVTVVPREGAVTYTVSVNTLAEPAE